MNDGDKSLVCAEKVLVDAADRHMRGIVPLYYEMRKAAPQVISNQSIYEGMTTAFSGGNIGPISNNITKIWNSVNPDIDTIKRLCYRNNEVIDRIGRLAQQCASEEAGEPAHAGCFGVNAARANGKSLKQ